MPANLLIIEIQTIFYRPILWKICENYISKYSVMLHNPCFNIINSSYLYYYIVHCAQISYVCPNAVSFQTFYHKLNIIHLHQLPYGQTLRVSCHWPGDQSASHTTNKARSGNHDCHYPYSAAGRQQGPSKITQHFYF